MLVLPRLGLARRVLHRRPAGAPHDLGAALRRGAGDLAERAASRADEAGWPTSSRDGRAGVDDRRHADERLHAVRAGGASTCGCPASSRRPPTPAASACRASAMSVVHHRDAGRHVVRLRDLRLHQRRGRPEARLRVVSRSRPPCCIAIYVSVRDPGRAARCSGRSSRSSPPATSAASARSRPRSTRPASARRRRASPTTSAGSRAPRRRSPSARWRRHAGFDVALSTTSVAFVLAAVTVVLDSGDAGAGAQLSAAAHEDTSLAVRCSRPRSLRLPRAVASIPAYDDDTIAWEPGLIGQWVDADDKASIPIERGEWKSYSSTTCTRSRPAT